MKMLAQELAPFMPPSVDLKAVEEMVDAKMGGAARRFEIKTPRAHVTLDNQHSMMDVILKKMDAGLENILLVGPSGTGKSVMARMLAKGLSIPFHSVTMTEMTRDSHIWGRTDIKSGETIETPGPATQAALEGGVLCVDEMNKGDANINAGMNGLLDCWMSPSRSFATPQGKTMTRHADCRIVCCSNTDGSGPSSEYVAENRQDASLRDRFPLGVIYVDYDKKLEASLAGDTPACKEFLDKVWKLREDCTKHRIKRVMSTRLVVAGRIMLTAANCDQTPADLIREFTQSWTPDERAKIGG